MTARRRLVPLAEVKEAMDFLRKEGVSIAGVDIRADGVTFYPPNQGGANAYDRWKSQDKNGPRSASR